MAKPCFNHLQDFLSITVDIYRGAGILENFLTIEKKKRLVVEAVLPLLLAERTTLSLEAGLSEAGAESCPSRSRGSIQAGLNQMFSSVVLEI